MNVEVAGSQFKMAVGAASRAVGSQRAADGSIGSVMLSFGKDGLTVDGRAGDGEIHVSTDVSVQQPITGESGNTIELRSDIFGRQVQALESDVFRLQTTTTSTGSDAEDSIGVVLQGGRTKYRSKAVALPEGAAAVAAMGSGEPEATMTMNRTSLLDALKAALPSVDNKQNYRVQFTSLLIEMMADKLSCVGTNGYRLAQAVVAPTECSLAQDATIQANIPRRAATMIVDLLSGVDDETVAIEMHEDAFRIVTKGQRVTARRLNVSVLAYQRIFDDRKDLPVSLHVDGSELRDRLRKIRAVVHSTELQRVILRAKGDQLVLTGKSDSEEDAVTSMPCEFTGSKWVMGVRIDFLDDAVNCVGSGKVHMKTSEDVSLGILLTGDSRIEQRHVLMPLTLGPDEIDDEPETAAGPEDGAG